MVAVVLVARKEQLQQIALAEEKERLRREAEVLERETEAAKRVQEEAAGV